MGEHAAGEHAAGAAIDGVCEVGGVSMGDCELEVAVAGEGVVCDYSVD